MFWSYRKVFNRIQRKWHVCLLFIYRQQSNSFTIDMGFPQLSKFLAAPSTAWSSSQLVCVECSATKRASTSKTAGELAEHKWKCTDATSLLGAAISGHCAVSFSFIAASNDKHDSNNSRRRYSRRDESSLCRPASWCGSQHVLFTMPAIERCARNEFCYE